MSKRKEDYYVKSYEAGDGSAKSRKKSGRLAMAERKQTVGSKLSFAAAEAYKLLRTNLILSMADEAKCKIIGVSSALRGEGKSTTSLNLAYSIAEAGKKALLIEADMRIPVAAKVLEIAEEPGLSDVLAGLCNLAEALRFNVLLDQLCVLPAGQIPPNPSEMLSSERMKRVVETLAESFDYIIVDLPPINAVSDGLTISKLLSGMVLVVRENYCDQHALAEAMRQLEFLQVRVLGFVVNDSAPEGSHYKKYGSTYRKHYGYGSHYYGYEYGYGYRNHGTAQASEKPKETGPGDG